MIEMTRSWTDRRHWLSLARALVVAVGLAAASVPFWGLSVSPAYAVEPDEILKDPVLEARAREISTVLRCPVCQNQSIDDSNAPLARDLRLIVRERLTAGDSNSAVVDFVVARYGEFVLLKPTFGWHTALLWIAPFAMLLAVMAFIASRLLTARRASHASAPAPVGGMSAALTDDEKSRLAGLLVEKPGKPRETPPG